MRMILGCLLLVVAPSCLWPFSPSIERVTVTSVGIYELETKKGAHGGSSPSERAWDVVTKFRRLKSTTTIPAWSCISFGFEYAIVGAPVGAEVPIRMVTKFPSQGILNRETGKTMYRNEAVVHRAIGRTHFRSYTLDEPWALVPGTWTFELWYKDRKLAEQSFTLIKPCSNGCDRSDMPKRGCKDGLVSLSGYDPRRMAAPSVTRTAYPLDP